MAFQLTTCPHCTMNGVSDGHCHIYPVTQKHCISGQWTDTGISTSCQLCCKAAVSRGEKLNSFWSSISGDIVICHVCFGMKRVMLNTETAEIRPLKLVKAEK